MALNDYCIVNEEGGTTPETGGTYVQIADYEGHMAFYCGEVDQYLYYIATDENWYIYATLGEDGWLAFALYEVTGANPNGEYYPYSEDAEGNPYVDWTEVPDISIPVLMHHYKMMAGE